MSFWKSKAKTPAELVKCLKDTIPKLDHQGEKKKVNEEISKTLVLTKGILYGEIDADPSPELVAQLSQEIYNNDILPLLIQYIGKFEFEVFFHSPANLERQRKTSRKYSTIFSGGRSVLDFPPPNTSSHARKSYRPYQILMRIKKSR
jgi:hypothetical protein